MAAVSVYYYFRVIQAMYFKEGEAQVWKLLPFSFHADFTFQLLLCLLGIFPQWLINQIVRYLFVSVDS